MQVRIVEDPDDVAELASASIARWLREADGPRSLGLAGGSTPRATYSRLREEDVPWADVDLWMGDERWVPPGHSESNARMARETLASHVPARLHAVPYGDDPVAAAADYGTTLRLLLSGPDGEVSPTVIILGMGDDGHTASLFPGSPALSNRRDLYVAEHVAAKNAWRLTATLPLLWAAHRIAFLITGSAKAATLARVLGGESDLPVRRVLDGAGNVTFFLDRAAASHLTEHRS